uniref:Uncharacterized protein n=1 Tax=Strongyloides venezuelensis TaxID=75913 RepID=A0A0K0FDU0_STRVS
MIATNRTPKLQSLEHSSLEDVQFTTPKSIHRALDGKVNKSNVRSRIRNGLANPRKLFDGKSINRSTLFKQNNSENMVKEAFNRCNVVSDSRGKISSCKKEDDDYIDLRCTETFLDEPTHEKSNDREKIDQLNNLLSYMEDLSTKDSKEAYISYRKNCTPPSRAGERRNGAIDYYNDNSAMEQN